jgi:hypothetical protein
MQSIDSPGAKLFEIKILNRKKILFSKKNQINLSKHLIKFRPNISVKLMIHRTAWFFRFSCFSVSTKSCLSALVCSEEYVISPFRKQNCY